MKRQFSERGLAFLARKMIQQWIDDGKPKNGKSAIETWARWYRSYAQEQYDARCRRAYHA